MGVLDWLLLGLTAAILGGAAWYIRKRKRRGTGCIGCPHSGNCGNCSGGQV